ncbi:2-(1,2-epoxy-1,2-dihydrophenyl)acetyl-CoA isomerase [Nocardioides zeae]|uniref:2-(1,2-epoxy-1,2-dihydrophenyl)acetyl-CoA isomerase n=1 Tax=Nocardioides zeae TaxID=1457234 RepID=A0ACC6IK18_9ACTN|nr:enoyl-CoA hydratase-related protein [Nocardioides zeae]MDR6173552.1 2-(1,2-epoxy-1,2-dihydrophenyl)acetyl-CoA isomerase [Nocardioides zeae]MDR6210957.1 2-(1,2-epoxy-1,2-dihydrophenyl)acetyl-CoA isomerase [Nocardioides zeae]
MSAEQTHVAYAYDAESGIARITLDDAAAGNPIHTASLEQLLAAARRVNADGARVVVLAARGRFFSVGGDLAQFGGADDMAAYIDDLADGLHRAVSELVRSDAIVVAAVQGAAAGAGFPLVAAADIVLAARSASFTLAYTRAGLSPDGGSSMLVHTLGLHRALRLALLNDRLGAEEAQAAGLVARVVEDAELEAATEEIAGRLAAGAAGAQATTKRLLRQAAEPAPETRLRAEALGIRAQAGGPEGREGVSAFLAKRPPVFGG